MVIFKSVKFLFLLSLVAFLCPVLAADKVTPLETEQEEVSDLVTLYLNQADATSANRFSYNPYTEVSNGGDPSSNAHPFITYLAFQNGSNTSVHQYFVKGLGTQTKGPLFLDSTVTTTQSIKMPLELDTDGRRSVFVAINIENTSAFSGEEDSNISFTSTDWRVVYKTSVDVTSTSTSDLSYDLSFDPRILCNTTNVDPKVCDELTNGSIERFKLFIFLADDGDSNNSINVGDEVNLDTYSGKGIFWDLKVSSKIPSLNSAIVLKSDLIPGEARLKFDHTISNSITDFKDKVILYSTSSASPGSLDFATVFTSMTSPVISIDNYGTSLSGELTLKGLSNGTKYYAYLGVVDKYFLAPNFSTQASGTPAKISELLEKNACFFLTAGFREDNKIIRSFRFFRDHWLLKIPMGKAFVKAYYFVGPLLAPYILKSEALALVIRSWSTALYKMIMYSTELIGLLFTLFLMILLRKFRLPFSKESDTMTK